MLRYVFKRILQLIPVFLLVSFLVFWLMDMAGDPVSIMMGEQGTQEQIELKREELGLNRPLVVRYAEYMSNLFRGDFGESLYGGDVWEDFSRRLPYSLLLVTTAIIITAVVSITLGVFAALHKGSWFDAGASIIAMFGVSAPIFWVGLMLILLFGVKLGWLPTAGIQEGVLIGLILPACSCTINCMGGVTRMTRSSMLDQLGADYLRTARAKGVKEHTVVWKHALRNALLPIITSLGSYFSTLLGGAVTLEMVFAWPGIGTMIVDAVKCRDFTVVTGCVLMLTLMVTAVNLIVDVSYALVDPRIKAQFTRK